MQARTTAGKEVEKLLQNTQAAPAETLPLMEEGELLPDDVVLECFEASQLCRKQLPETCIVQSVLATRSRIEHGFVLDGFPFSTAQALLPVHVTRYRMLPCVMLLCAE